MYWKRQPIIDEKKLLNIFNQNTNNTYEHDILKRCQSITSYNYCKYIHQTGKNKGLICGSVSKQKNGKCYTHSRHKCKIVNKKYNNPNKIIIINININLIIKFALLYENKKYISYNDHYIKKPTDLISYKYIFILPEKIYVIIKSLLFNCYVKKEDKNFLNIKNVENNQQFINVKNKSIQKKSRKKKNKLKKVIKLNNDINVKDIASNMVMTLNIFDEKVPKNELAYTLHLLFNENVELFKVYINIILSNIDFFFKNVNMEIISKIWKQNIEYVQYNHVLIYSDNNHEDIIEKIFSYVKVNYNIIPKYVKVLWVDYYKNSVIPYKNKYQIEFYKSGISVYDKRDMKRNTPLPLDKLTILYY